MFGGLQYVEGLIIIIGVLRYFIPVYRNMNIFVGSYLSLGSQKLLADFPFVKVCADRITLSCTIPSTLTSATMFEYSFFFLITNYSA